MEELARTLGACSCTRCWCRTGGGPPGAPKHRHGHPRSRNDPPCTVHIPPHPHPRPHPPPPCYTLLGLSRSSRLRSIRAERACAHVHRNTHTRHRTSSQTHPRRGAPHDPGTRTQLLQTKTHLLRVDRLPSFPHVQLLSSPRPRPTHTARPPPRPLPSHAVHRTPARSRHGYEHTPTHACTDSEPPPTPPLPPIPPPPPIPHNTTQYTAAL
jgi:hypothetical protein